MKIVNIIGGVGNQMFQYAFAYILSKINPTEKVYIDTSLFNGYGLHNGFEMDRLFGLKLPIAKWYQIAKVNWYMPSYKLSRAVRNILPQRKSVYRNYMYMTYDKEALFQKGDKYYDGYWQTAKYYEGYRDEIIDLFRFRPIEDSINKKLASLILKDNTVGIHIRRGDYLNSPIYKGLCGVDYYKEAIRNAKNHIVNPIFFIFSNDIQWCKDNLMDIIGDCNILFVDNNFGENSYRDMQLLSMARCVILANSSFSWWAAYLNERDDKLVIAPKKWANLDRGEDIYMDEWIRI